jgi:MFS family permease
MGIELFCRRELVYSLILALGSLTFGYVMGYPSSAVVEWKKQWFSIPELQFTFFTSVTTLTAIAGPFIANGLLSPSLPLGRKKTTFIIAVAATIFWLLFLLLKEERFWLGIVIRALLGLTVGAFSAVVPMYIVELAPEEVSGFFGSIHQLCVALGFVILYLVATWLNWKAVAVGGAIITGLLALLVWAVPEPVPKDLGANGEQVEKESPFQKKWAPRLILGALLAFFQQLSGINAILVNLIELFENARLDLEPTVASAIAASAQVLACLISGFLVDKLGRKLVWVVSFGGIAITDVLYGVTEVSSIKAAGTFPAWVPLLVIFVNLLAFGAGAGPIPWFIVPELFPDSVRAPANAFVVACNWIFAFAVVQLFPTMRSGMGLWGVFVLYGVVSFIAAIYGAFNIKASRKDEEIGDAGRPVYDGGSGAIRKSGAVPGELDDIDGDRRRSSISQSTTDPLLESPDAPV